MVQIFLAFLLTSFVGTVLALILTLLRPLTRKIFSAGWHYYMWLVVLLTMILPIRLNLPEASVIKEHSSEITKITENQMKMGKIDIPEIQPEHIIQKQPIQTKKASTVQDLKEFLRGKVIMLSYIWLVGLVLLLIIKITNYMIFLIKINKHSNPIFCPEIRAYTSRKIRIRASDTICSPLIFGVIKPTLLLPNTDITSEQLDNILAHEMTHLKRNDILYKWFVSIIKCVHWFNPMIYYINKQIKIDCEISCDLAVVKDMDAQAKKRYVETILSLLTFNNSKAIPLTTGMTGNKQMLKKRFNMIKKKEKIGKPTYVFSIAVSVVLLITVLCANGVLATKYLKKEPCPTIERETSADTTEIVKNTSLLENYTTYNEVNKTKNDIEIPKTDSVNIDTNSISSSIKQQNNDTKQHLTKPEKFIEPNNSPVNSIAKKIKSSEKSSELYSGFEHIVIENASTQEIQDTLAQNGITKSHNNTADLSRNYIVNDYTYEDGLKYDYSGVKCDNNGNISVYFAVNSDNLIDIQFYDTETKEEVGGYGILANNENAYTFIGFDSDKSYDITIQGKTKDTLKIEGEYIIY